MTVKEELLAGWPLTVTENGPEVEPTGTIATIPVSLQLVTVAFVPFNATVLVPCVAPKLVPAIATDDPMGPEVGEMLVIVGA